MEFLPWEPLQTYLERVCTFVIVMSGVLSPVPESFSSLEGFLYPPPSEGAFRHLNGRWGVR